MNNPAHYVDYGSMSKIKIPTPMNIQAGLDLEQHLLDQVLTGEISSGYALWRSQQALVVPKSATHREHYAEACRFCETLGWPVVARSTGGELTPQSEGFINLSLVIKCKRKQLNIKDSYHIICDAIMQWLANYKIQSHCSSIDGAFCDGDFNIVIGNQKLVGTAQRWKKITDPLTRADGSDMAILMHAVILCDGDLPAMWDISNTFYKTCNLEPFIKGNKHTSLAQLFNKGGEDFVLEMLDSLDSSMSKYIDTLLSQSFK